MAESDTILQLGIEAAREGNREEARNLFTLLTSQDPDNVQGWLWLAGVASGPDERRAALEKVITLDPTNEMAVRGLQAMGVNPASTGRSTAAPTPTPTDLPPPAPVPANLSDEERYAAELDSAFDDYDTVERVAPAPRNDPTPLFDDTGTTARGSTAGVTEPTERVRTTARRPSRRDRDDGGTTSGLGGVGGGLSLQRILIGAIAVVIVLLLVVWLWNTLSGGGQPDGVALGGTPTAVVETPDNGIGGTGVITDNGSLTPTNVITGSEPLSPTETLPTTEPLVPTPGVPSDLASANPAPQPVGTVLSAEGWNYTFPNACLGSCGAVLGNQIGGNTAQGVYVVVLAFISNGTGTAQPIPADFFVLKDAQGRIYQALPQVSQAFTQRGVNADLSLADPVPSNNATTSVNLIFDVPRDATNLTLFTRSNTGQGFQVLGAAQ
ncbi:MAG TPA: hypothetical protein VFS21_23420 [Roseiflexaceae bacterium]|nr:hypothetical protein [Roseiflexaceae bacterium]